MIENFRMAHVRSEKSTNIFDVYRPSLQTSKQMSTKFSAEILAKLPAVSLV